MGRNIPEAFVPVWDAPVRPVHFSHNTQYRYVAQSVVLQSTVLGLNSPLRRDTTFRGHSQLFAIYFCARTL